MILKMRESFYVNSNGIARGLALWWMEDVNLSILKFEKYFIDAKISIEGEEVWFMTFIYGPRYADEKEEFWRSLSSLRNNRVEKWCLIGDSNVVAKPEEKIGGLTFEASNAKWFYDFMDCSCLIELPIKGRTFTWSNLRSEDEAVLEKLG
ncbi:hypothetical protein V6N12_063178 [Hibiscus sabdariffa]|uniref:Uncharacterized protein n=1 Tax=Hibiscus sabdariffa TaxID=183260 RepID=A0ABR2FAZ4_9ROSI